MASRVAELGVQLYTVRDALRQDFYGTMERLLAIGFTVFEPWDFMEWESRLTDFVADHPGSLRTGHEALLRRDTGSVLESAARLGITTVFEPYLTEPYWESFTAIANIADRLNAAVDPAASLGLKVGYHNHYWEFSTLGGSDMSRFDYFASRLRPEVAIEVDTYWAEAAETDVPELLNNLASRDLFLHLKDGPLLQDLSHRQVVLGQGSASVNRTVEAALLSGAELIILELDEFDGDMFDALEESLEKARTLLG